MKWLLYILLPLVSLGNNPINWEKIDPSGTTRHVWAGIGITSLSGAITYKISHNTKLTFGVAIPAGIVSTVVKEVVYDGMMGKGTRSNTDIIAGSYGTTIGTICLVIGINTHKKNKHPELFLEEYFED